MAIAQAWGQATCQPTRLHAVDRAFALAGDGAT
jgi:hypothetical protein